MEINGNATAHDGETIASRSWKQLQGSQVSLNVLDLNALHFQFEAPSTGAADSVIIEWQFTVEDSAGASTTESVVVTVMRVNQPPVVDAGGDQTVDGLTEVTLQATVEDPDGEIASYLWTQTGGEYTVELSGSDQSSATFQAPSTDAVLDLEFSVAVTDSDGATVSDSVAIQVFSENAPDVVLAFPPAGIYDDSSSISAFGAVEAKADASVDTVRVSAGSGSVLATVNSDGSWQADGIAVPASGNFTLTATAEDDGGRIALAKSELTRSHRDVRGSGNLWATSVGLIKEPGTDNLWLLSAGENALFPINVRSGSRGSSITDVDDPAQGIAVSDYQDLAYNHDLGRFYISVAGASGDPMIVAIDKSTGQRTLVSGPQKGSGTALEKPFGITVDSTGWVIVADNGASMIQRIDPATGDRTNFADAEDIGQDSFPAAWVDWDSKNNRAIAFLHFANKGVLIKADSTTAEMFAIDYRGNYGDFLMGTIGPAFALTVDSEGQRAFIIGSWGHLGYADLSSGDREVLSEGLVQFNSNDSAALAFDHESGVLYAAISSQVGTTGEGRIYAFNPDTGEKVMISGF